MKKLALIAAALAMSACSQAVSDAKTVVSEQLVDSSSAQFENVVEQRTILVDGIIEPVKVPAVCGWVNGANRMGGMAGPQRFIVKAGVRTFRPEAESGSWAEEFSNCIIHSDNDEAVDRLTRE